MRPYEVWMIEHAAMLGAVTAGGGAVVAAILGPRIVDGVRRWRRRSLLRRLGEPRTHASDGRAREATVEGVLEGHGDNEILVLQGDRGRSGDAPEPSPGWAAPALVLVTPLGRIALRGRVELRAGRRAHDVRIEGPGTALHRGDRVRVAGVLEGVSGGASHGESYRDANVAWRLVPGAPGALIAAHTEVTRASRGARARVLAAFLGGLGGLVALTLLGVLALARLDHLRGPVTAFGPRLLCAGEGLHWGAIATLSPFTRRRAFDGILRTLECREPRGLDDLAAHDRVLRGTVADPLRQCLQRADLFERARRFEEAAALYATCGTSLARSRAAALWAGAALYDRASALVKPETARVTDVAHLLTHQVPWHLLAGDLGAAREALARARSLESETRRGGRARTVALHTLAVRCGLLALDETATETVRAAAGCTLGSIERPVRCADEVRVTALDDGAEARNLEGLRREVGRESLGHALARGEVRAVLRAARAEPPHRAVALLVALVRAGQRNREDRALLRAFVETEFPHAPDAYDAGTLRWIAGALDHPRLLAEARAVGQRQCEAQRRAAGRPAGYALRALRGW